MNQGIALLKVPVILTANATIDRGVSPTGGVPAAGGRCLGPAFNTEVSGNPVSVTVIGTAPWESGGVFARGDKLQVDASGRVVVFSAGVFVGIALEASTAIGQKPEVFVVPN
jgi:hypothetical protein